MNKPAAIAAEIPRLRRYARALVGDVSEADDLVQECLARALESQSQWRHGTSPLNWLFTILHNLSIDEMRRRKRRPREVELDPSVPDRGASHGGAGVMAIEIGDALALLPEDQRRTLLLVALEGLSYAEVADVLGIPIGTVMSRIARGRDQMRRTLYDDDGRNRRLKRVK